MASLSFDEVNEARKIFHDSYHEYWLENALFTWQWWFLLIAVITAWIVWWKFLDKRRLFPLLVYGLIFGVISVIFDMVGENHGAWAYPIRLYWAFIPPLLPFDHTYLPIIFMLVYQRYGKNKGRAFIAFTITAAFISFIVEPFFRWSGIYVSHNWKDVYSLPIYIALAFLVRFLVGFFEKVQNKQLG